MITAAQIQMIRNADPGAVLPGIDTKTGNPLAASSLLDAAKITQNSTAPYYYSPSKNIVFVSKAGAVLSGINFGTATVYISASNVTIKDCDFGGTTNFWAVRQSSGASGATVENCTFQGDKLPGKSGNVTWISSAQPITVKDNNFLYSQNDAVDISSGLVTGNYFSGAGYLPGAHADAIWVTNSTGPTTITDNFIDWTPNADAPAQPNNDVRLTNELGNLNNVTVSGNYLIGGGYTVDVGGGGATYQTTNVSVANNYIGFGQFGPFVPNTSSYATLTGNTIVDFSNPVYSTQAMAAYLAAGVPTATVVSATSSGSLSASGSTPTTMLGNGFVGAHLFGGAGETNFVGGFGAQYLFGGKGVNIFTYLAMSDGGDSISSFNPAKDVIDLSHIDANITTPGVQNFKFIGSAPFSGGAQVRYQFNPAKNTTIVQAALAGDSTADFSITLAGLDPLTAANFALTSSQSAADLSAGAAGVPTPTVVSAISSGSLSASGSAPTTMLGNGFVGAHLFGGAGETNFVGGFGAQYLFGGQGVNIFTYLAMSDGGDSIAYFDPAKDVIDLSHIDANITMPGVQNFKFIGSAPFSGGGQVRYQFNPTKNTTIVQAALAGDSTADFSITLAGLDPLTAANFALTSSQSAADLSAGAALTRSKVQTAAGAPTEYAYSNVQGRDYGSYQSFAGSSGIAAEYFDLSATSHELALYSPNLTVTRAGGSESLQVGTASDPLAYNSVETIDATTSGNEHFILSAGFGHETIKGFVTSGTSSDTIQLAKSAFSYLTAGMTQAQDLAAVLTTGGAMSSSGLTINDSHGDSLTLAGVTSSMIAANPGMFAFT